MFQSHWCLGRKILAILTKSRTYNPVAVEFEGQGDFLFKSFRILGGAGDVGHIAFELRLSVVLQEPVAVGSFQEELASHGVFSGVGGKSLA